MDCRLPGPSVHGIFQAKILEWVANSRDLSDPGTEPVSPGSPELQADSSPQSDQGSPLSKSCSFALSDQIPPKWILKLSNRGGFLP